MFFAKPRETKSKVPILVVESYAVKPYFRRVVRHVFFVHFLKAWGSVPIPDFTFITYPRKKFYMFGNLSVILYLIPCLPLQL